MRWTLPTQLTEVGDEYVENPYSTSVLQYILPAYAHPARRRKEHPPTRLPLAKPSQRVLSAQRWTTTRRATDPPTLRLQASGRRLGGGGGGRWGWLGIFGCGGSGAYVRLRYDLRSRQLVHILNISHGKQTYLL